MKILITGGFGFIGSSLATKLHESGHEVKIVDYALNPPEFRTVKYSSFNQLDITDLKSVLSLDVKNYDCVCHLAGQPSAAISFSDPYKDLQLNTQTTLNLLELCREKNIPRILYASTFNVYKEIEGKEIYSIKDHVEAKSPYAISKIASENYIKTLSKKFGITYGIQRMFNVYGPGQDFNNKSLGMLNIFLTMARNEGQVKVKGSLDRFRDFIFIDDVVDIWYRIIQMNESIVTNVGTGKKSYISDLIESIRIALELDNLPIEILEGTPGDFKGAIADLSLNEDIYNDFKITGLSDGIKKFVNWTKKL
mgnify:CR=1 FL=1